ncbi:hypothetical protein Q1695_008051 [Nippostrongylus brasiliensis]|nr:hypothetical protein Q1695_008051 [Nippostrongylus brasiliensis]
MEAAQVAELQPLPAARRGPLPPIQTKRRMSASWTENLEPSPEARTPEALKSPESKASSSKTFFSRSNSEVRPFPEEEILSPTKSSSSSDPKEPEKSEKKNSRRDSIKDHLLKFKMKAGKVLDDVHDRLVDDHSTVAVAPLMSPANQSQDRTSVDVDESTSMDDRVVSPSLSQSSRRTTTSAELKASMRSRLRKQAEQTVERKRGSVHLAKRLQRRLTIHQEEGPTEGELQSVDEQIEHSLKIGARFLQEQTSMYPPDDVQFAFFVEDYDEKATSPPRVNGAEAVKYCRAEMISDDDTSNLVYYESRPVDLESNNRAATTRMTQRLSDKFFSDGKLRRIDETQFTRPLKIIDNEEVSCNYVKAQPWESFVDEIRGNDYVQLDLFVGGVFFEQHPLASEEDKLHVRVSSLYDEQCYRINEMTEALMDAENSETGENSAALRDYADQLYQDVRRAAQNLLKEYADLERCRNQQGFTTSPLRYTIDQEEENGSLLGKLTMDSPLTPLGALPAAERSRIETLKKTSLQVLLHFNDMFICKTKTMPLDGFRHKLDHTYNLEIISEPRTITATIIEKLGTKRKNVIKVNIPLPADNDDNDTNSRTQIAFEGAEGSIKGFIVAGSAWSTEMRTKRRRESAASQPTNAMDMPFAIIPAAVRLISDEEFDSNPRWNALESRSRKRNANWRIPMDGSDVDVPSTASGDDRRTKALFRTTVDAVRAVGRANAIRLRTKLLDNENDAAALTYSEIVREEPLPGLFGALGSLFGPADLSRKLKPMRRTPIRQQNFSPSSLNLVVNVQSGMNLPTRSDGQVHAVVEVEFQNSRCSTPSVSGRNPSWHHGLSLPVDGVNDLKSIIDCVKLNVYDQESWGIGYLLGKSKDSNPPENEQRTEKRYDED